MVRAQNKSIIVHYTVQYIIQLNKKQKKALKFVVNLYV